MLEHTLHRHTVADIMALSGMQPSTVGIDQDMETLVKTLVANPHTEQVYVVDNRRRVAGSVRLQRVVEYLFPYETLWQCNELLGAFSQFYRESIADFMDEDIARVYEDTGLSKVVEIMARKKTNEVAVLNRPGRLVGAAHMHAIITLYLQKREKEAEYA
jgi:Mg/Co/Ni transporter MgtE